MVLEHSKYAWQCKFVIFLELYSIWAFHLEFWLFDFQVYGRLRGCLEQSIVSTESWYLFSCQVYTCPFLVKHQHISDLKYDKESPEPRHSVIFIFLSNLEVDPHKCPYPNLTLLASMSAFCIRAVGPIWQFTYSVWKSSPVLIFDLQVLWHWDLSTFILESKKPEQTTKRLETILLQSLN